MTVFATVGFGDITAVSQAARLAVTTQMMLDLLVLGLGVRVFVGAVQFARRQAGPGSPARTDTAAKRRHTVIAPGPASDQARRSA